MASAGAPPQEDLDASAPAVAPSPEPVPPVDTTIAGTEATVGAAAADAQAGPASGAEVTYGPYRRSSGDGLLGTDWPRSPNGTGKSGFIDDQAGMRYSFSLTLTCVSGHTDVEYQWFEKVAQFAHVFCHRAAIGLERGGSRRILHVQAVLEIGLDYRGDSSKIAAALRQKIRKLCGFVRAKIILKELVPTQTFTRESPLLPFLTYSHASVSTSPPSAIFSASPICHYMVHALTVFCAPS